MFKAGYEGQTRYGTTNAPYMISGKDGVHPGWAGHLVMAYTFLRAMGLDGDIGTLTVDLGAQTATATAGHTVESFTNNQLTVVSTKYPFCAGGETDSDNSIRSGATLVPFFETLSRFRLVIANAPAARYQIAWGNTTNIYTSAQLAAGVNLAADFADNPFCEPFKKVDEAVKAKQAYETRQIKQAFHSKDAKADMASGGGADRGRARPPRRRHRRRHDAGAPHHHHPSRSINRGNCPSPAKYRPAGTWPPRHTGAECSHRWARTCRDGREHGG